MPKVSLMPMCSPPCWSTSACLFQELCRPSLFVQVTAVFNLARVLQFPCHGAVYVPVFMRFKSCRMSLFFTLLFHGILRTVLWYLSTKAPSSSLEIVMWFIAHICILPQEKCILLRFLPWSVCILVHSNIIISSLLVASSHWHSDSDNTSMPIL